jgi:hypothetical protein
MYRFMAVALSRTLADWMIRERRQLVQTTDRTRRDIGSDWRAVDPLQNGSNFAR